ncbi:MAG: hypothetical protein WKF71_00170 [Pyrinomonadaceae bacterium]
MMAEIPGRKHQFIYGRKICAKPFLKMPRSYQTRDGDFTLTFRLPTSSNFVGTTSYKSSRRRTDLGIFTTHD